MKTIIEILNITPEEYQSVVLRSYIDWCMRQKTSDQNIQKLMNYQPLYNWWIKEYQKNEQEFIKDVSFYPESHQNEKRQLYLNFTEKVFTKFSKPLIQKAYDTQTN